MLAHRFDICLHQQDYVGAELLANEAQLRLNTPLEPQKALPPFLLRFVVRDRSALLKATVDPAVDPDQRVAAARLLGGLQFPQRGTG